MNTKLKIFLVVVFYTLAASIALYAEVKPPTVPIVLWSLYIEEYHNEVPCAGNCGPWYVEQP